MNLSKMVDKCLNDAYSQAKKLFLPWKYINLTFKTGQRGKCADFTETCNSPWTTTMWRNVDCGCKMLKLITYNFSAILIMECTKYDCVYTFIKSWEWHSKYYKKSTVIPFTMHDYAHLKDYDRNCNTCLIFLAIHNTPGICCINSHSLDSGN